MFTGIIEEVGDVLEASEGRLRIGCKIVHEGTQLGDSVAINGVDLTVVKIDGESLFFDCMPETYRRSNLGELRAGDPVNLERSLQPTSRLSGHIVRGVVEATGALLSLTPEADAIIGRYGAPADILRHTVVKGPITVDGVSLTVIAKDDESFSVSLVQFTQEHTNLTRKKPGDTINLESDIIARYVDQLLSERKSSLTPRRGANRERYKGMKSGPQQLGPGLAASKNAEAMNHVVRGRFREALRVLNEAIYSSPEYPHSYANRALVFERLGMLPQAEADRNRARQLAGAGGYDEEEVFATSGLLSRPAAPRRISRSRREARPQSRSQSRPRLRGIPEFVIVAVALVGMAATGFGLFMAANAISGADINLNVFDFETFQASEPEATTGPTAPPTPEPTPPPATPPPEALAGNPFSFSNLESAWKGKGITVTPSNLNTGFSGFKAIPFDVKLTRGADSASLSVIIYPGRDTPKEDWNLSAGSRPSPQTGRSLPAHETIWWNTNVIIVVRSSGAVGNEAREAFFALGG